ncbi:hypothetical protein [Methanobrevibacter sp.]|uniref:hypothetical protein n=1 Tax=Methanobrevibacter sp. TaxID=66852 RepID=UPI00388DC5FF
MVSKRLMVSDQEQYQKYYNLMKNYKPLNDYITKEELSKDTKYKYYGALASYCCSQNESFDKLLDEAQNEEKSNIPLAERNVHKRLDVFKDFLRDEGYVEKTADRRVKVVRSFYRLNGISLIENNRSLDINPEIRKHIEDSDIFKDFIDSLNLENESTIGGYLTSLTGYCDYYNMTIEELIQEADEEEESNVRLSKRKIKKRLIEYRKHLSKNYANSTIRTKMSDITYFYVINDIEIPKLPKANYPYEPELTFDEIPTLDDVKRALETTTSIKNRALFLFCLTSGSSSKEARTLSVEEYILGTKECHGETTDIQKALEKMEGNMEFIPVFHLVRTKKKRDYYTCITPEANQYIINYLKTRDQLTLDDKVFDYSRKSLINAFQHVNDTNNWGWVNNNRQRRFTCHQLRRLNANIIDNGKLVHMIQGKKFDPTVRAYFKQDPKKVRDKYTKEVRKLTIYEKYKTHTLTDENYAEMQEQIEEKDTIIKQQEEEIKSLKESHTTLNNTVGNLSERLKEMDRQLKHLNNNEPQNIETKSTINSILWFFTKPKISSDINIDSLNDISAEIDDEFENMTPEKLEKWDQETEKFLSKVDEDEALLDELEVNKFTFSLNDEEREAIYNSELGKRLRTFNQAELLTIQELTYEIASNNPNFNPTTEELTKIIKRAIFKMKRNPDLIIKVTNYHEDLDNRIQKHAEIFDLLDKKMDELGLWNEEETTVLKTKIITEVMENRQYAEQEVTEDIVMDLIEKNM